MKEKESAVWNNLAKRHANQAHIDPIIGRYKSNEFLRLVNRWLPDLSQKKILKTDLREEAFGSDEVLFSLPQKECDIYGVDISSAVVAAASRQRPSSAHAYLTGDVRRLPFEDNCFDIILSNSTLDHFVDDADFLLALSELRRVMHPEGRLLLTLNNKYNLNFRCMAACEAVLKRKEYPIRFFSMYDIQTACDQCGLEITVCDSIIHIISPINSLLIMCRKVLPENISVLIARVGIVFAKLLGSSPYIKRFTGWFLAVCCVVKEVKDMDS